MLDNIFPRSFAPFSCLLSSSAIAQPPRDHISTESASSMGTRPTFHKEHEAIHPGSRTVGTVRHLLCAFVFSKALRSVRSVLRAVHETFPRCLVPCSRDVTHWNTLEGECNLVFLQRSGEGICFLGLKDSDPRFMKRKAPK